MNILHVVNVSFVIPYFLGHQLNWFKEKGNQEYVVCSPSEELESFSDSGGESRPKMLFLSLNVKIDSLQK